MYDETYISNRIYKENMIFVNIDLLLFIKKNLVLIPQKNMC